MEFHGKAGTGEVRASGAGSVDGFLRLDHNSRPSWFSAAHSAEAMTTSLVRQRLSPVSSLCLSK
jgi:hypothetical protein